MNTINKLILFSAILSLCTAARADHRLLVTTAELSGAAEAPPNASPGTGFAVVTYDSTAHTLRVEITFSGLLGPTTVAHIHAPTAEAGTGNVGVAVQPGTFTGFPAGVTSGAYDHTLDLTATVNYTGGFLTLSGGTAEGAEAKLIESILEGRAYVNVHSQVFPAGEIRGFLRVDSDADGVPDSADPFPNSRDIGGNVIIGDCDTGVPNVLFPDGSTISDQVYDLASRAKNHGRFVSGVAKLKNDLRKTSVLTPAQAEAIQACAARSNLP
jgi:hypothetical protein